MIYIITITHDTAAIPNSDITSRCQSLASDVESLGTDANEENCCSFCAKQLHLMSTVAKSRRYSFSFSYKLPACYEALKKIICLLINVLLLDNS